MSTTTRSGRPIPTQSSFTAPRSTLPAGRWREAALCSQVDPELFFSEHGNPATAKRICLSCPVRVECLDDALARNEIHGVWGGLTTGERAAERRHRRASERSTPVAA